MTKTVTRVTATKTKEKAPKVTEATRFGYMGEELIIEDEDRLAVLSEIAEYAAAAAVLHAAKARAFKAEDAIKERMKGFEHLVVDGERKASWTWGKKTTFDKRAAENENPGFIAKHTHSVMNAVRSFNAKGIVGVD